MATAVQLTLELDDGGSLSFVDKLKQKWNAFTGDLRSQFNALGQAGGNAFKGIEDKERQAHVAAQLWVRTTGIEMPRALETVIARSQALGPIMQGLFGGSVFAAVIPVIGEIGSKIKEAAEELAGYSAAVKQMYQDTVAASTQSLVSPKTLEAAQKNLTSLQEQRKTQEQIADAYGRLPLEIRAAVGVLSLFDDKAKEIRNSQDASVKSQKNINELLENMTGLGEKRNQQQDEFTAKANEAGKVGYALLAQQRQDFLDSQQLTALKTQNAQEAAKKIALYEQQYQGEVMALQRQNAEQTIALRHSVTEDGLMGIAKIRQAEIDALEDVDRREKQTLISREDASSQRALIEQRTSQQIIEYQRQEQQETRNMQNEAVLAGLEGDAKIIASAQFKKEAVGALLARGLIDDKNYNARIIAINTDTNNQLLQSEKERLRKTRELQDQAAEDQKTAEEDAALAVVPEWQRATAQLEIELNRRLRSIQNEKIKELSAEQLTKDQIVAINQIADAKTYDALVTTQERIREEHKRTVEQMGSDLESVFDDVASGNLGKRIIANMKKLFFQILAEWILTSQQMKSIFGGLFGTMLFGPGSMESQIGQGGGIGGFGGILGGIFSGGGIPGISPAGGTPPFFPGQNFGASSAAISTGILGNPATNALASAAFGNSNTLNTQSISSASDAIAAGGFLPSTAGGSASQRGLFGGFLNGGVANALNPALAAVSLLGLSIAGSKSGITQFLTPNGLFNFGENHGAVLGSIAGFLSLGLFGLFSGLFGGLFGGGKRKKAAEQYFSSQVQPAIKEIVANYEDHQLDYGTATSNLEQLRGQAQDQLKSLKGEGKDEFRKVVSPAIDAAETQIANDENERNRRAGLVFGPPQFHEGGDVSAAAHAAWTTRPGELLALLKDGERVMSPRANAKYGRTLQKMEDGGAISHGGDTHVHIYALDAESFDRWARNGGAKRMSKAIDRYKIAEGGS